jgi:hypothetical protein
MFNSSGASTKADISAPLRLQMEQLHRTPDSILSWENEKDTAPQ